MNGAPPGSHCINCPPTTTLNTPSAGDRLLLAARGQLQEEDLMNPCVEVLQTVWVSICQLAALYLFLFFYMLHINGGGSAALLNELCKSVSKTHKSNRKKEKKCFQC